MVMLVCQATINCHQLQNVCFPSWPWLWPFRKWVSVTMMNEKSARRRRKHCTLAVVRWSQKFFAPPGAQDSQNLISWRWPLPLPTNPVWWGSVHAISCYRGNRPTNTHIQTDRGDYNTLCHGLACSVINPSPATVPCTIFDKSRRKNCFGIYF